MTIKMAAADLYLVILQYLNTKIAILFSDNSFQHSDLIDIGKQDEKKYAFEAGVMRSDLSEDLYNKMLCTEEVIRCQGQYGTNSDKINMNMSAWYTGKSVKCSPSLTPATGAHTCSCY